MQKQLPLLPLLSHNDLTTSELILGFANFIFQQPISTYHCETYCHSHENYEKNQHSVFQLCAKQPNIGQCSLLI